MKLAIMQPYFLPYPGYFALIKHSNKWIFNDEVQMIRKGWVERNRILRQSGGWHYIRVPLVRHSHTTLIKDVRIRNHEPWKEKIIAQLGHYRRKAPYYYKVINFLKSAFLTEFETITAQNAHLMEQTCQYIGFNMEYDILSDMNLELGEIVEPDDWSLHICEALGYDHYLNPILGKSFYSREKYEKHGIELEFLRLKEIPYPQLGNKFIGGLSIVDMMMFNTPEEINTMLDQFTLE
ncbi:MAG: WbqC family protein [bacterium]|jgi:hypothetical protein